MSHDALSISFSKFHSTRLFVMMSVLDLFAVLSLNPQTLESYCYEMCNCDRVSNKVAPTCVTLN